MSPGTDARLLLKLDNGGINIYPLDFLFFLKANSADKLLVKEGRKFFELKVWGIWTMLLLHNSMFSDKSPIKQLANLCWLIETVLYYVSCSATCVNLNKKKQKWGKI